MEVSITLLEYLAGIAIRSFGLVVIAAAAVFLLRVRSAAARHAVWTMALGGMILLAAFSRALPPLPLRLLKPAPADVRIDLAALPPLPAEPSAPPVPRAPAHRSYTWQDAAAAIYAIGVLASLSRLGFGYLFTLRLSRAAQPTTLAPNVFTSTWISVPMTIGLFRPKIFLPADWATWPHSKLHAALAHESTHVERADWAIMLLAGVNRSLFWFHPAAWWIERTLASLAEHACDDSALLLVGHQPYAQALLEMAAAVQSRQGRLVWEAMAMAKAAEVRKRIERILDDTRQIPHALTRSRWVALAALTLPLTYLAAVVQIVPAAAQEQPRTPAAMTEYLKGKRQFTPTDVRLMEQYLVANPQDREVRAQLINYYYGNNVRQPRLNHIFWMIANAPDSIATIFASMGITRTTTSFNDAADFQTALGLWKQQAAAHPRDPQVLGNAAQFLQHAGDFAGAEKLIVDARTIAPSQNWTAKLAELYAKAILGATGDPHFPNAPADFARRVQTDLEASTDGLLQFEAGRALASVAQRPNDGKPLPNGVLNLNDHPLLVAAIDLGERLSKAAAEHGGPRQTTIQVRTPNGGSETVTNFVPPRPAAEAGMVATPPVVKKVLPEYSYLAHYAHIESDIHLMTTIGTDGTVRHIDVLSGHPLLVPPALEALRQWTFTPPASEVRTEIVIPFRLDDPSLKVQPPPTGEGFTATYPVKRADGSVPSAQPALPARIRVGGNVQQSKLTDRVDPVYPAQARADRIEDDVKLTVTIAPDGHVEKVEAIEGNPVLAAAATDAVMQWRYKPTLLNQQPVTVITTVTVPFHLQ